MIDGSQSSLQTVLVTVSIEKDTMRNKTITDIITTIIIAIDGTTTITTKMGVVTAEGLIGISWQTVATPNQ